MARAQALIAYAPIPLRLGLGLILLVHGAQKIFVLGPGQVAGYFANLGLEPSGLLAWVAIAVEFGGGVCLLLGLLTRLVGLLFAIEMAVAIWKYHAPQGFYVSQNSYGYEFAMLLIAGCLALILAGPGRFAVDRPVGIEK
ncbi:MAG: DoxX family protein [Candidatus Rokubacteria bacterium]|nr:DoxX family protein [Candidatus Rokubacteria bacterium]